MSEITFELDFNRRTPLYEQLYQRIVQEIHAGTLCDGDPLPSKRALAEHLGISRNTIETAYGLLVAEGYVRSIPRSGYRVMPVARIAPSVVSDSVPVSVPEDAAQTISLSTGAIDTSAFPYSSWARIMKEVVYENPEFLQRGHFQGDLAFRQALASFLHQYRGVDCQPEQIIVGAGMEYLLHQVLQLFPMKTTIALEDPGYSTTYHAVQHSGHPLLPVPVDHHGMNISALRESDAQIAYVTPSHQFPTGVTMPVGRRTQLLQWASESPDRYIIEDDYDSEFRYATRTIPAMQSLDSAHNVIYMSSFNRTIAPAIRVAYMVLPPSLLTKYQETFSYSSCTVSRFEQQALCRFIEQGLYGRHLRRELQIYRRRSALLIERLKEIPGTSISGDGAGLHFLLTVSGHTEQELLSKASDAGIRIHGLSQYYHLGTPPQATLVIGFGGCDEETIEKAAAILKQVWG